MTEVDIEPRHWQTLGTELKKRTFMPARHPSFVIFFFVAIAGIGPLGIWTELTTFTLETSKGIGGVRSAFVSFVPAFLAATCMQLVWAEDYRRSLRAFSIFVFFLCAIGIRLCYVIPDGYKKSVLSIGFCLVILSMWMWWIANAYQKEFMDEIRDFDNPIGGSNLDAPLAGSLNGFNAD
jgi:hypothetical protein